MQKESNKLLQKQQSDVQINNNNNNNTNIDEKEPQKNNTSTLLPQCKVFTFQTPLSINHDDDTDKNQNQHLIKGLTSFQQIDSILTDTFIKPTPEVICIDSDDDDDIDIDEHIYRTHDHHQNISMVHTALKTEPVNRNLINSVRDKFKNKQNQNQNLVEIQNMNSLQKQKSQMSSFQLALLSSSSSSSSSYIESPSNSIYNDPIDTMKLEDIKQYDCVSPSSFMNTVPSSSVSINPEKVLDQLQLHPGLEDVENTIRQYLEKEKQEMEQKIESQQNKYKDKDKDKDETPKSKSMKYKEDDAITLRMKKSLEKMNLQLEQSIIRDFEWNLDCDLS